MASFDDSTDKDNQYNHQTRKPNYNRKNYTSKRPYHNANPPHNNNSRWNRMNTDDNRYGNNSWRGRGRGRGRARRGGARRGNTNYNNRQSNQHNTRNNNNNYNQSSYHHPLNRSNDTGPSSLRSNDYRQRNSTRFNRERPTPRTTTTTTVTSEDIPTKCAYATMVINNAEYLSGAFTLAWSLMIAGCKADRIIIIDEDINEKYGELISLSGLFTDKLVIPKKLHFTAIQKRWKRYTESGIYDWINTAFNKYYVFTLTQYSRVIMLDADQICLQNLDELFLLSCPAGICSFYSDTNNALQHRHHGYRVSNTDIRKSYETQWGIKGCLFMIEPSQATFKDMLDQLEYLQTHNHGVGNRKCFLGADEKFLTKYYMTNASDSNWTHVHAKFSRLSYIDKTALSGDPYLLHYCTFKPWKSPGNDKWIHEQWEDIAIWLYASYTAALYIKNHLAQDVAGKYTQMIADIMSPDRQFYSDVLKQPWSKKYMTGVPGTPLLKLYHIMGESYQEQQAKKHHKTLDLKRKIKQKVGSNQTREDKKQCWSFDYSKHLLLSALLLEQNEAKITIPDKVIWQFWDKKEDEMPVNIQLCVDSVRNNNPDWTHVLLTPHNIWNYVNQNELKLPSNLLQYEKACHVSDVIRVAILAKYGGIYCDATIICFRDCQFMNFNYIWDELLMAQAYDFVGFRYDNSKRKWKYDEKFCCWFMATKKDNGLFYSWLNKINLLMKDDKTSSAQLDIIDLLYGDGVKSNAFKKYVALGPGILDELFEEYCHYHRNFKYMLYDPREFALLDERFNYEQLWYLNSNSEYNFKQWFQTKSPHFIKLFCAAKGSKQLYEIVKHKCNYKDDAQVTSQDIMNSGLIIADIFTFV
eukprot:74340_1